MIWLKIKSFNISFKFKNCQSSCFYHHIQAIPSQGKSEGFDSCDWPSNLTQIGLNHWLISPRDLEIWWMTLKNNKAPLLYYIKLCASFPIHWWIQTGVAVRKCSIRVKIGNFLSCVTLKFDGWLWKIVGRLFYTTLSFVQHFKAIADRFTPHWINV